MKKRKGTTVWNLCYIWGGSNLPGRIPRNSGFKDGRYKGYESEKCH